MFETISLINLSGISTPTWSDHHVNAPPAQTDLRVRTYTERPVQTVWWASPDHGDPQARQVDFTTGRDGAGRYLEFVVPALTYWDLIVLEE